MADKASGRPMIYPYTQGARLVQFPYRLYFEKGWALKYYCLALVVTLPFFHKISKGGNY